MVDGAVVSEGDPRRAVVQGLAVYFYLGHAAAYVAWIFDGDVVAGRVILETQFVTLPCGWDARLDH